jgi:hypothetical protein
VEVMVIVGVDVDDRVSVNVRVDEGVGDKVSV